jgi:hypothetical protein
MQTAPSALVRRSPFGDGFHSSRFAIGLLHRNEASIALPTGFNPPEPGRDVLSFLGRQTPGGRRTPDAGRHVDHDPFDELLRKYVDGKGLVDYEQWSASEKNRDRLEGYLEQFALHRMTKRLVRAPALRRRGRARAGSPRRA